MMMKGLIFVCLLITQAAWAQRPEVVVASEVEISQKPVLRLADIAQVKNGDEALLAFMESVILKEDARELLLSQSLSASDILKKIRGALPSRDASGTTPLFKIPTSVKVNFAKDSVSKEEVSRRILNYLQVRCADCEYKVTIQGVPALETKDWSLDFAQLGEKGGFLLPVRQKNAGEGNKWISGLIHVSRLTPVATRLILQGERLQEADFRFEMKDVTFAKDNVLPSASIIGQLAARSLPVGSAIWSTDLKREPAAQRGQTVKAILGEEGFEISLSMIAEENGFVGDTIKLKNTENKKILSGVVLEKGVVKLL